MRRSNGYKDDTDTTTVQHNHCSYDKNTTCDSSFNKLGG